MKAISHFKKSLHVFVMLCILLAFKETKSQNVYIPDPNFRAYLQINFAGCMVGPSQDSLNTQCGSVLTTTFVSVGSKNISDLTGIQYFLGLHRLNCSFNPLTSLPSLPNSLRILFCIDNQLTSFPSLPDSLRILVCYNNQLTSLPLLPAGLKSLYCQINQLTSLPYLPVTLQQLDCSYNPISCLPILPNLLSLIEISSTQITCVPNHPILTYTLNSFPICTPANNACVYGGNISGISYHDANQNCTYDIGELLLKNRIIEIPKITGGSFYASTDSNGYYYANVDTGIYTVSQHHQTNFTISCPNVPYTLTITSIANNYTNIDIPNNSDSCKYLTVDIATARQRIGSDHNHYYVNYCNNGVTPVDNVYIGITFDPEVIPLSSTLPWSNVSANTYTFTIGTINPMDCGTFIITDSVNVNALLNQAACATAVIAPVDTNCFQAQGNWDHSRLAVTGTCNGTTADFTIENIGSGDMDAPASYKVYEDDVLVTTPILPALNAGANFPVSIPSNGKTLRVEVDQRPGIPGYSLKPKAIIELCGNPNQSVHHVTSVAPDDADDYIETACVELNNSYDPNHKQAMPTGFTSNNYIYNNDELEYTIEFQNTGNDTAYKVTLSDTIDVIHLDITTIKPGVSSHPYQMQLWGANEAIFVFNNINLLAASADSIKSQGFVKFKIKQKTGNPVGTNIDNKAYIYFDYNSPIITNIANVEIFQDAVVLGINKNYNMEDVKLYPNPFNDELNVSVSGVHQTTQFELYDVLGNIILSQKGNALQKININRKVLAPGSYFYKVYADDNLVGTGMLIAK